MSYQLSFVEMIAYNSGQPSITVPVTLSVSQALVNCDARVDTGSSNCIFARNVGEELGLDIETGMRLLVGTVTGNFVAYLHEVNLSLGSFEFSCFVGFAEEKQFQRNVLGRRGFIEQVVLGLVDYEGKLYLSCYDQ